MSDYKHGGLDRKYIITKKSRKPVDPEAEYFVLRLDKDPHARVASAAYAQSVKSDNKALSFDLKQWLVSINKRVV
jgi:hypothetical protein